MNFDFKKFLSTFWPTLIPALALASTAFSDQLSVALATHPTLSLAIFTFVTAVANKLDPKK